MITSFDFAIRPGGPVSDEFLGRGIKSFAEAPQFVSKLNYGRNKNKADLLSVFTDNCGTCSTKHALLKMLAEENGDTRLKLMLGIFNMNRANTPKISAILDQYGLPEMPEAHNYLRVEGQMMDFTRAGTSSSGPVDEMMAEMEICPAQIKEFKVSYHKKYLSVWLTSHPELKYTLPELWNIREQCIMALSAKKKS